MSAYLPQLIYDGNTPQDNALLTPQNMNAMFILAL